MVGSFGSGTELLMTTVWGSGAVAVRFAVTEEWFSLGGQRLAVRPLEVRAQLVGPGELVLRARPRLREARDGVEVARRLVGEGGVLDVPRLERGDDDADQRAHAVDALGLANVEGHIASVVLALRADGGDAGRHHCDEDGDGQDAAIHGAQASPSLWTNWATGLSHGVHISVQLRKRSRRR
jgi:hypothetical protein